MAEYVFTQSDTRPFFAIVVRNSITNAVVDLTGATVTFSMRHQKAKATETPVVNGAACTVTDAAAGAVEYRWGATDLDVPGLYTAEFKIVHSDTKSQRIQISDVEVLRKVGTA